MKQVNFHKKRFKLVDNSVNGTVDGQTIFHYQQEGDLVTADYSGGSIVYGKIIAQHCGDRLQMLYTCYTHHKELKAGKATARISTTNEGKIELYLDWRWLNGGGKGRSTYIEM